MAADHLRLALVGYGKIAPKHIEVFRELGATIVAACNRSEAGRTRAKVEGSIARVYGSIVEMLEREKPDGVLCLASFPEIFSAAQVILPFGIPTLLEKPPGTSLAEFATLKDLAAKHSTPCLIGLNRRYYSVITRAVEDAGGLDRVRGVFVEWSEDPRHVLERHPIDAVFRWTFGNTLHGLDLMTLLAGPVDDPAIVVRDDGEPLRSTFLLQGSSRRGVAVSFHSTWDAPGKWRVTFVVPNRRYIFAPLESCTVMERGARTDRVIEPSEVDRRFKPGFYEQARAFCDVVRTRDVPFERSLGSAEPAMLLAEGLTRAMRRHAAA